MRVWMKSTKPEWYRVRKKISRLRQQELPEAFFIS